MLNLII